MTEYDNKNQGQFGLLGQRRFAPFFCTQFLGAFNDNVFKNALLLLIAYQATRFSSLDTDLLNNIAAGLFILPFFIFSALAGQLADKYEKSGLIQLLKITELLAMIGAAAAFYFQSLWGLLLVLFLMGTQSAFFGPVKYSIIPQYLKEDELVSGNAFVEMGTFLAILLGTASAGVLMQSQQETVWISVLVCTLALLGCFASFWIPRVNAVARDIRINLNPLTETGAILRYAYSNRTVFLAILGISWFWFLGASYLTQLPNYSIEVLSAQESVVTLLLCIFSVGIGVGSLLCDKLSGHKVEIGIVPLGSLGLSLFGLDLYFASDFSAVDYLRSLREFLETDGSVRILIDMGMIGIFGGFFIVPLYAMVQQRTAAEHRARVIAANNVLNALLMVLAALVAILLLGVAGLSKAEYFAVLAVMNVAVAWFIYNEVPEFGMRFLVWLLGHSLYRVKHQGLENIPEKGAAILVCNHVSYVDALLLAGAVHRPIRFVMHKSIFDIPVLNYIFRAGRAIPICSRKDNPEVYERAFESIKKGLDRGELFCIFPEGKLTLDGNINEFKPGIEKIVETSAVPVVPIALRGLWGSFFSHQGFGTFLTWPKKLWAKIDVVVGARVEPQQVSAQLLYEKVSALRGDKR